RKRGAAPAPGRDRKAGKIERRGSSWDASGYHAPLQVVQRQQAPRGEEETGHHRDAPQRLVLPGSGEPGQIRIRGRGNEDFGRDRRSSSAPRGRRRRRRRRRRRGGGRDTLGGL